LGPMIAENEAKRVEKWVHDAAASGAKILVGGKREGSFFGKSGGGGGRRR
jgi:acyl-CoA reductase-like NAD-dependent aldehyde dehydrogenase